MKLKNKFIVIVPVFNQPERIVECLKSIIDQDFGDIGIIVRDDCSTDDTYGEADHFLFKYMSDAVFSKRVNGFSCGNLQNGEITMEMPGRDVVLVENKSKLYPCGNIYESVRDYVENDDAVIGTVDGDDLLYNKHAITAVMSEYNQGDRWLVWSQHQNQNGVRGCSTPLPPDEVIYRNRYYWSVSHFRTAKAWLYKQIDPTALVDFFDRTSYIKMCGDAALLYQMIEMSGNERAKFIDEVLYQYNDNTGLNEHSPGTVQMQHRYSALIKHLPIRRKLEKRP